MHHLYIHRKKAMANKISYVKNEDPSFIKAFKQKTGYKEGPTVDSKREVLSYEDEDRSDNEDEKPTIVVLKEGDLTAEEAEVALKGQNSEANDTEPEPSDGKITFKKPAKRQSETSSELHVTSSKKQKDEKKKQKSSAKEVKNSSLLSFDEEEEEDT